ncbi:juvenile hormone acid O-methyltransferase-like isoform X2 [Cimex lectularius]|uniref:Methyltransferase domain-containing protein n=1 Tax=Cimex lectularius TaxID=79782 RepID=A0A8I6TJA1_CIMLE|nr:juvenile hormone acid O-methyltransferase-like isoform X2 [Cimex lectularius]
MRSFVLLLTVALVTARPKNWYKMMLENPILYSRESEDHQNEAKWCLERYGNRLKWTKDESVLDFGCGTGDVSVKILFPYIKDKISSMLCVDMDPKMITFAKKQFKEPKVKFEVFDVGQAENISKISPVDKIFSFFALQWVGDRSTLGANIYQLLKPGGQTFLLLVAKNGLYFVWDEVAKTAKWRPYLTDEIEHLNEYAYSDDPLSLFTEALRNAGVKIEFAEQIQRENVFKSRKLTDELMIQKIRTVDPYVSKIPHELRADYLQDVLTLTKKMVSPKGATDYTGLIVIASRPK